MINNTSQSETVRIADMLALAENTPDGYIATQTNVNEAVHKLAQTMIAADSQESGLDIAAQGSPDDAMATLMQRLDALGESLSPGSEYLDALKQMIRDEGLSFARQTRATPLYARLAIINGSPDDLPACQHYHYMIIDGEGAYRRNKEAVNAPQLTIFGTQSTQSRLPVLGPLQAQKGKKALLIYFASMNAEDETQLDIANSHTAEDNPVIDNHAAPDADTVPDASTASAYGETENPAYDTLDAVFMENEEGPEAAPSHSVTGEITDAAYDDNTANGGPNNAHPDIVITKTEFAEDSFEHGDRQLQDDIAADQSKEVQHNPDQEDLTPASHNETSLEEQNADPGKLDPGGGDAQIRTAESGFDNEAAHISHAELNDTPQTGEDEAQLAIASSHTAEDNPVIDSDTVPNADTVLDANTASAYDETEAPAYDTPDGISIKNEEAPEAGPSHSVTDEITDIAHDDNTANGGPNNAHPDIVITKTEFAEDSFAKEAVNISHAELSDDPQMGEDETQLGIARPATAEANLVSEDEPGPRYADHAADKTIYPQDAISGGGAEYAEPESEKGFSSTWDKPEIQQADAVQRHGTITSARDMTLSGATAHAGAAYPQNGLKPVQSSSASYKPQVTAAQNNSAPTATTKPAAQQVFCSPKTQASPQSGASTATGNAALATAVTVNAGDTQMRLNATFDQHSRSAPEALQPSIPTQTETVAVSPANDRASATPVTEKDDAPQSQSGPDEKRQEAESKAPETRQVTDGQPKVQPESAQTNGKDNGAHDTAAESKGKAGAENKDTTTPVQQASDHKQRPTGDVPRNTDYSQRLHGSPRSPEEETRGHPPGCVCKLCSGETAGSEAIQTQDADDLFGVNKGYTPMANDAGASGPETDTANHPPGCGCKLCAGDSSGTEAVQSADPFADLTATDVVSEERHKRHHPEPV